MSGTIAYCSREDQIYPIFASNLARLAQKHPEAKIVQSIGNDIAAQRNQAVLQAEGDWIWFIDTDMVFAPEIIDRLLRHEVDVVQALCLKRHPPHQPILWERDPNTEVDFPTGRPRLIEVACVGSGGTLYRRRVFEAIKGPWFEGILGVEDINFARKIVEAGFKLYTDLTTPVGHTTPMVIWPERQDETWGIRYDAMNGQSVHINQSRIVTP